MKISGLTFARFAAHAVLLAVVALACLGCGKAEPTMPASDCKCACDCSCVDCKCVAGGAYLDRQKNVFHEPSKKCCINCQCKPKNAKEPDCCKDKE